MQPKNPLLQKCFNYLESLPHIEATLQGEPYFSSEVLADGKLIIKTSNKQEGKTMEITKTINYKDATITIKIRQTVISNNSDWGIEISRDTVEMAEIIIDRQGKKHYFGHLPEILDERFSSKEIKEAMKNGAYAKIENTMIRKEMYEAIMNTVTEIRAEMAASEESKEYNETVAAIEEKENAVARKEAVEYEELINEEIPAAAIAAYNEYDGDADAAWEEEDETAWALIRKYERAIEAQHGIAKGKFGKMLQEAARAEYREV